MSSLFHLITKENEDFNMGKDEWEAITKIKEDMAFMKGRMSILLPILIASMASFLTSIGTLIAMLLMIRGG